MQTPKSRWDIERAAPWLRRHGWGAGGEEPAPAQALDSPGLDSPVLAVPAQAETDAMTPDQAPAPGHGHSEEIDIAGWPALVAPFYD